MPPHPSTPPPAPNGHEPHYLPFFAEVGEHPAMMLMDLSYGMGEGGPPKGYPMFIEITVGVRTKTEDGLPTDEDSAALDEFDEEMVDTITAACHGLFVGNMSCQNRRYWFFYGKKTDGVDLAARRVVAGLKVIPPFAQPEQRVKQDPKWEVYESLMPTADQQRFALDMQVIHQLAEGGDNLETPRDITHFAFFPSAKEREEFKAWCPANGFEVVEEVGEDDDEDETFGMTFKHHGPATPDEVSERTMLAQEGAEECGGQYDGWETALMKDDEG